MSEIELDTPKFRDWLVTALRRLGADTINDLTISDVSRPGAGQSNETFLFDAVWHDGRTRRRAKLVARLQPSGQQIFLAADVVREGRVIDGVYEAGTAPVPQVIGTESDRSVLGRPFFVMRQVAGRVPLARPSIHRVGWLTELSSAERQTLWNSAMDALVAVHRTDWASYHDFLLDGLDPSGLLQRHVERLVDWYRWTTQGRRYPITDAGIARLVIGLPAVATTDPVLVWSDARVGNMIFGADNRVAAVIDWEVATVGSPAIDLAHWLFFDDFMTTASGIAPLHGWPDRATTIAEYEARSGRTVTDLAYFELMEEVFMATTLIRQSDFRVERGLAAADTRMGHDNAVTQMLARRLGLAEPPLSPDYLAHRGLQVPA
jgi:aminoglycoside phosphotransferase (APT) family kinase protein